MTPHDRRSHARQSMAAAATAVLLFAATLAQASEPDRRQPLRVALNKAEVIALSAAASVVLVASPQIADVVVERGKILFVLGKRPGETRLYVYGDNGQRLLERDVIVVPTQERTVTVTRGTRATDYGCDGRCAALGFSAGVDATSGTEAALPGPAAPAAAVAVPQAAPPATTPAK